MGESDTYRFPLEKDASWNSYGRQKQRYQIISNALGRDSKGAEIGVYKGGFGEFLLPHCRHLFLVDPWYRLKPQWNVAVENSTVDALINILNVYREDIHRRRVSVIVDFGVEFLLSLEAGELDWVYLDASHSYEDTVRELDAACRAVRTGGWILGDDYDPDPASKQHGVFLAVNEILTRRGLRLEINESRQYGFRNSP